MAFMRRLAQGIEAVAAEARKGGWAAGGQGQGQAWGRPQSIVHNIQLVRACPFYGYHATDKIFIKIIL